MRSTKVIHIVSCHAEDEVGNVIIKKPAAKGFENRKTIVMQSHLDMVHQKNSDTVFDWQPLDDLLTAGFDGYYHARDERV